MQFLQVFSEFIALMAGVVILAVVIDKLWRRIFYTKPKGE